MLAKISYTWQLMGASWGVLKRDPRLLIFPAMSGLCCLLVLISFAVPVFSSDLLEPSRSGDSPQQQTMWYVLLFLFYFANYFVITFFNTAIIACAISRMAGGEPSIAGGFSEAFKRIHLIFGWALVSATVGLIVRIIEERSELIGKIVAGLLGAAWTMLSFLVVPILVVEEKGPLAALKESASLFRRTWGEQPVGNFSFGLIFFLLAIPAYVLGGLGFYLMFAGGATALGLGLISLAIVYIILLALIQSALQSIFQAAVYMYTQGVSGGPGFPVTLLRDAMAQK